MQVTIDSKESLDEVLSVLSTMFDTRIVTDPTGTAAAPATTTKPAEPVKPVKGSRRPVTPKGKAAVDAAAVRAWARDQGTVVTDRGALSKKLIAAYQAAQA